jgi:hypothetical protein
MTNQITPAADLAAKIEAKRYDYFTFPILEITIKYRKPDILKLALNKALPAVMASAVIRAYKANVEGRTKEVQAELASEKVEATDEFLGQLEDRGYLLLKELCVSHKILDVPQSDFENSVISWTDIPEEDAMAFLLNLIKKAQNAANAQGGEMSGEDIVEFPDGGRSTKRSSTSKNGKNVRQAA